MDLPGLDEVGRFVHRREAETLQRALAEGETIRLSLDGHHNGSPGLLAATDVRILFAPKAILRRVVQSWPFEDLAAVDVEAHQGEAHLRLHFASEGPAFTLQARKGAAEAFREAVAPFVAQRTFRRARIVADPRQADPIPEGQSTVERLQRLDRMRQRGTITEPEYRVNRRRILEEAGLPTDLRPPLSARATDPAKRRR
jgi:hypothetical protein